MNMYDKKPIGKDICALCCKRFMDCTRTELTDIKSCDTYIVLKYRHGNKTIGEIIEGERNAEVKSHDNS